MFNSDVNKDLRSLNTLEDIEFAVKRIDELKSKCDKYDVLVKALFELLDRTEESDEGRVFRPVQISCCRALDADKLEQVLKELKQTLED
jgi:hypothetical protein